MEDKDRNRRSMWRAVAIFALGCVLLMFILVSVTAFYVRPVPRPCPAPSASPVVHVSSTSPSAVPSTSPSTGGGSGTGKG